MRLWEIAGLLLLLIGLFLFYEIFVLVVNEGRIIEAGPLVAIGFIVFRGGIHLLEVSAAAAICREQSHVRETKAVALAAKPRETRLDLVPRRS